MVRRSAHLAAADERALEDTTVSAAARALAIPEILERVLSEIPDQCGHYRTLAMRLNRLWHDTMQAYVLSEVSVWSSWVWLRCSSENHRHTLSVTNSLSDCPGAYRFIKSLCLQGVGPRWQVCEFPESAISTIRQCTHLRHLTLDSFALYDWVDYSRHLGTTPLATIVSLTMLWNDDEHPTSVFTEISKLFKLLPALTTLDCFYSPAYFDYPTNVAGFCEITKAPVSTLDSLILDLGGLDPAVFVTMFEGLRKHLVGLKKLAIDCYVYGHGDISSYLPDTLEQFSFTTSATMMEGLLESLVDPAYLPALTRTPKLVMRKDWWDPGGAAITQELVTQAIDGLKQRRSIVDVASAIEALYSLVYEAEADPAF